MKSDEVIHKTADPQKILALLADNVNEKEFTTDYPICPICKNITKHFGDNDRTSKRELNFATGSDFENLTHEDKFNRINQVGESKT